MSVQISFDEYALSKKRHITKKDKFLQTMDSVIDWDRLLTIVSPYYYANKKGRKPYEAETMLRMYFLREWYGLTDAATEDAIYDSYAMRRFMKLDFTREKVPDASTLLKFRKMLAKHKLSKQVLTLASEDIADKRYVCKKSRTTELSVRKIPSRKKQS